MTKNSRRFDPRNYPIVTRVLEGYLEVSQPDLGIYRFKKRFDDVKRADEIGNMILDVMKEAVEEFTILLYSYYRKLTEVKLELHMKLAITIFMFLNLI